VAPDDHQVEYTFDQLGVRVPALLISPWVSRAVDHTQFDHTSVLKYLIDKWNLAPMGRRAAAANSIAEAIREPQARTDTIPFIRVSYTQLMPAHPEWETQDGSIHHQALQLFAEHLAAQMHGAPVQAAAEAQRISQVVAKVRSGALGVPKALRALGASGF
jgi:phospholipase C